MSMTSPLQERVNAPRTAGEIAAIAEQYVGGDRQETHGAKGACFRMMNAADDFLVSLDYQGNRPPPGVVSALRMILYKMCRVYGGKHNLDDYIDMAGYAACAGEVAELAEHEVRRIHPVEGN